MMMIYWFFFFCWLFTDFTDYSLIWQLNVRLLAPKYKTITTANLFYLSVFGLFSTSKMSLLYERDRVGGREGEKEKVGTKVKSK